jgi:hypothetical protein
MIRVGRYDAFDKWEILCRYWENKESVRDIGADRWGRSLIAKWHDKATAFGTRCSLEYIAEKVRSRKVEPGAASHPVDGSTGIEEESFVYAEITRLWAHLGLAKLQSSVRELVQTTTHSGYLTAFDGGLSPQLVIRLREVFRHGALEALKWTEDDGEVPSLSILHSQAGAFPIAAVKHKAKALCMFCCRFFGRQDVIRVHNAGPDSVTLVDNDAAGMENMRMIYPAHWNYVTADYGEFLAQAAQSGSSYDLIVADPWKTMCDKVAWDALPTIMRICSDTFITGYSSEMFKELNVQPDDLDGLSRAVGERTGVGIVFTQTVLRTYPVYWAVMKRN